MTRPWTLSHLKSMKIFSSFIITFCLTGNVNADVTFINNTGQAATDFHFVITPIRLVGYTPPISAPWGPGTAVENGTGFDVTYTWQSSGLSIPDGSSFTLLGVNAASIFGAGSLYSDFKWTPSELPAIPSTVPEPEIYALLLAGLGVIRVIGRNRKIKQV